MTLACLCVLGSKTWINWLWKWGSHIFDFENDGKVSSNPFVFIFKSNSFLIWFQHLFQHQVFRGEPRHSGFGLSKDNINICLISAYESGKKFGSLVLAWLKTTGTSSGPKNFSNEYPKFEAILQIDPSRIGVFQCDILVSVDSYNH